MPTLIVKPLDPTAPGSYVARRRVRLAMRASRAAINRIEQIQAQVKALEGVENPDPTTEAAVEGFQREIFELTGKMTAAVEDLEDLLIAQARTDDGSPVEDVLAIISANDFDVLMGAMLGQSPVPTKSGGS
jgi:hypothetical protein